VGLLIPWGWYHLLIRLEKGGALISAGEPGKQGRPTPILYCKECGAEIQLAQDFWVDPPFVEDDTLEKDRKAGRTIVLFDEL